MQVTVNLNGQTPIMCHNVRLADKEDEITRAIAALTAKKKHKTDMDLAEIAWLEWFGGLYLDSNNKVVIPMANLVRLFREAAAITRRGKDIARALQPSTLSTPLIYSGPTDLKKLYIDKSFVARMPVKVGASKVMRVRPCFPQWKISADFELVEEIMDLRDLEAIVARAGVTTGLGDARILGYGRFSGEVVAAEMAKAA